MQFDASCGGSKINESIRKDEKTFPQKIRRTESQGLLVTLYQFARMVCLATDCGGS